MKKNVGNILIGCLIGLALGGGIHISYLFSSYKAPDAASIPVDAASIPADIMTGSVNINSDAIPLAATPAVGKNINVNDAEYRIKDGMLQYYDGEEWIDIADIDELSAK